MIKKKTAIFFILLANIIILAHAAVPHHHLPYQVFIISSQCSEDESGHKHLDAGHNHDHDNKNDNEYCLLKQVVGIPANSVRQECGCDYFADFHHDLGGFQAIIPDYEFACPSLSVSFNLRPPLLSSSYTCYASCVLGLRAPPCV